MHRASLSRFTLLPLVVSACMLLTLPALADSQARIVRLSDVQGAVEINKNTGMGFESAFVNFPVTQGSQLRTHDRGHAEIEFEDGSSMRLAPDTTVEFSRLGLSDTGKRTSVVHLVAGMVYVNWLGKDDFTLNFSQEKLALDHAAHFRVRASTEGADLAVFKGEVEAEGPAGQVTITKNKTANFDAADNDKYNVANNVSEAPLDSWDKEASAYHDEYAKNNSVDSPYGYGLSDLNYYGSYSNVPGYGMMWQPFFTSVGWDPFMDGAWGWYPGVGYMYASAYPWGWLPYRYGNWLFVPGFGWMWQPGGWGTWLTVPSYAGKTPVNFHPLVAPVTGTMKTIVVGKGGAALASQASRLVLRAGSAGLEIPRGSLANLSHLNRTVAKNGSAEVRPAPQFSASSPAPVAFSGAEAQSTSPAAGHAAAPTHVSAGTTHH